MFAGVPGGREGNPRMGLVAGHGRGAVVQDDQQKIVALVHGVDQSREPGMEKSGVADKGHHHLPVAREMPAAVLMEEPMQMR